MTLFEVLDKVRKSSGCYLVNAWTKKYDNGTTLCEYKVVETKRHRTPIVFVQVGYYNDTKEVIGATMYKPGDEASSVCLV